MNDTTITLTDIRRFWSLVQKTTSCWLWVGSPGETYGRFSWRNELVGAHRFAYELFVAAIPDGFQIDHLCRVKKCVNPDHMEVVDAATNVLRSNGPAALNARKEACKRGHPFDERNTYLLPNGKGRACRACRDAWRLTNIEKARASARKATAAYRARKHSTKSS